MPSQEAGGLEERDTSLYKKEMSRAVGELMQAAINEDPHGDAADFSRRKPIAVHSPYESEEQFAYLRYENDSR